VNGNCSCGLPALCFQPAVAGGIIYADLWGELSTHLALQVLFTQSFPVSLCYKLSTFQALGKVRLHPRPQACVFIYSSHGKWVFPPLLCSFPPSDTLTGFPTPGCWACTPTPARASLAHPACLFIVLGRIPFPQSWALSVPHPLSRMSLLFLLLITQFLFFPQVGVSLSRGYAAVAQACLWDTTVLRSSPCPRLPKPSGRRRLVAWGPALFLCLT
jgi:hypothetical protein